MAATDFHPGKEEHRPSAGMHPLARAIALALAGALAGCASQGLPPDAPAVDRAKAAFARKDYAEAARLLSDPAMKGDAAAQYALGYLYYYGRGVPQDFYRARSWLETSAQLGNREAKRALATLKVYGKLPPADAARPSSTAQAARPAPAPERAAASNPVTEPSAAAPSPAMAPASATPAGAAPQQAAAAPVTAAPEVKETAMAPAKPAPDAAPAVPASAAAVAPVVVVPTPAAPAQEERLPVAGVPVAPAPQSAAPAAEPAPPAPVVPVLPKENSTAADSETANAGAPVTEPAPELQARSPAEPVVDGAPEAAPVPAPAAPVEPDSVVLPGDAGAVARESGAEPVARPVALERPAPAAVTLVPGSEQAKPLIRNPVPRSERPRYTIHLLSSPSREDLLQTVRTFGLAQAAWYPVQQGNGTQYRLIFGGYATLAEAREALSALPEGLYARNPWVNNYPESVTITAFNGIPTARVAAVERDILR